MKLSEWTRHAAAQNHLGAFACMGFEGVGIKIPDTPDGPSGRGIRHSIAWQSERREGGRTHLDEDEVEQALWDFSRDRSNYWDLDKLCEVDLAIVGRWPVTLA